MIEKEFYRHQWIAFERHPMFNYGLVFKLITLSGYAAVCVGLAMFGMMLDLILRKGGAYHLVIDSFNYILPFVFLVDFVIKCLWKKNQAMWIEPYLALPIKRRRLFNFLLMKEFYSAWNLYLLFMLAPIAIQAVVPRFGISGAFLYMLFFYMVCIVNSLLVNMVHNLLRRSFGYSLLLLFFVAAVLCVLLVPAWSVRDRMVMAGTLVLNFNPAIWIGGLLVAVLLWQLNCCIMRRALYRDMQGKKASARSVSFSIPYIGRLGNAGMFVDLEIKMLFRSKSMRANLLAGLILTALFLLLISSPSENESFFNKTFHTMAAFGFTGIIMLSFIFTTESSFFDGLMARNSSVFGLLQGEYIFYALLSSLTLCLVLLLADSRQFSALFLISVYFYTIGFAYFLSIQHVVYNKGYMDTAQSSTFNRQGQSLNTRILTAAGICAPFFLAQAVSIIFNETVANYYMLATGIAFTLLANRWLGWTYRRFRKRRHINMEGFRSN